MNDHISHLTDSQMKKKLQHMVNEMSRLATCLENNGAPSLAQAIDSIIDGKRFLEAQIVPNFRFFETDGNIVAVPAVGDSARFRFADGSIANMKTIPTSQVANLFSKKKAS